jgi:glyoxylase I family protein
MLFTAIDHPAIACYDVRKLSKWYCDTFGMRVVAENGAEPPSMVIGWGDGVKGGTLVEVMPAREEGDHPAKFKRFQPGLRHMALRVTDFDAAYAKLKAAGVEFLGEPVTAVGGGRIISFRDPEGNELQIVQR